ncbi:MAG: HAD hydrolase-like protein [Helicobacteraceae bacterium]|nr:HAD hydrolase-like protein [Helicobacteraceae bacterium]
MTILFDLDGTLIDSTDAILQSFHNSYDVHKRVHPTDEQIKALIGYPLDVMYTNLGIEDEVVWDFVATYKEHYREISTKMTTLLPNALEAVELASTFARLGIVTTKTARYSKILMEYFDLMKHFEVLIGREDVENPKPHAEPILKALNLMKCSDKEQWIIGDTKLDLLSAQNANIKSVGVLCGYSNLEELSKYTPNIHNNSLDAVKFLHSIQS